MVRRQLIFVLPMVMLALNGTGRAADIYADLPDPTRPLTVAPSAPEVPAESEGAKPVEAKEEKVQRLSVSSIVLGVETKFAVINSRRVQEGDSLEGVRIQEIRAREVIVERNGMTERLRLLGNASAQAAKDSENVN